MYIIARMRSVSIAAIIPLLLYAQPNAIGQQSRYDMKPVAAADKKVFSIHQAGDNGLIISGSDITTATKDNQYGNTWLAKVSMDGSIQWEQTLPVKSARDIGNLVTVDGRSYTVMGMNGTQAQLLTISATGELVQTIPIPSQHRFYPQSFAATEQGFVVTGMTIPANGVTGYLSATRLDRSGAVLWQRAYPELGKADCRAVKALADGGFVMTGVAEATITTGQKNDKDIFAAKVSGTGELLWKYNYGGEGAQYANDIIQTADGGFMVCGSISTGPALHEDQKGFDAYVVKLSKTGSLEWQRTYRGDYQDNFNSLVQLKDEVLLSGLTSSGSGGLKTANAWLVSINEFGNENWQKKWDNAVGNQVTVSDDGSITLVGLQAVSGVCSPFIVTTAGNESSLGIDGHQPGDKILVYPSITKDKVMIQLPRGYESVEVEVLSATGQKVNAQVSESGYLRTVDLSSLSAGAYLVQVSMGSVHEVHKVVLQP